MSHDDHDGTTIVLQDEPVAGGRRGTALMWMGALLGGMAIAVLFLGFNWYTSMKSSTAMTTHVAELQKSLDTAKADLATAQKTATDATTRRGKDLEYITGLKAEITKLRGGGKPKTPDPYAQGYDPFAPDNR